MSKSVRRRIGGVSVYQHHGSWYHYHRACGKQVRSRACATEAQALVEASLLNAALVAAKAGLPLPGVAPPAPSRSPSSPPNTAPPTASSISPADLRRRFLHHHEHVAGSALSTVSRYRAATRHFIEFARTSSVRDITHLDVPKFVEYLRTIEVAPNGHPNTAKRQLRDKGIKYILECCRSMVRYGQQHGHLPGDLPNPFSEFRLSKLRVRNSKPVFVFDPDQELAFFRNADPWGFSIHFTLAKTGLRSGELTHILIEDVDLVGRWLHVRGKHDHTSDIFFLRAGH